jgi:transcriptional regulator with XRE-family HTH domain
MLRIRALRKSQDLTLKQLAEKAGISLKLLSKYELGTVDPPSSKLVPIAEALGVSVGRLYSSPRKQTANGHTPEAPHA